MPSLRFCGIILIILLMSPNSNFFIIDSLLRHSFLSRSPSYILFIVMRIYLTFLLYYSHNKLNFKVLLLAQSSNLQHNHLSPLILYHVLIQSKVYFVSYFLDIQTALPYYFYQIMEN